MISGSALVVDGINVQIILYVLIFVSTTVFFYKSPSYIPFNNRVLVVFAGASTNIKREVSMEEV